MYIHDMQKEWEGYLPALTRQPDFDDFWDRSLTQSAAQPLNACWEEEEYPGGYVRVWRLVYDGFQDRTPIHGLFLLPSFAGDGPLPCLVHYHGLGGNCGTTADFASWLVQGFAVLSVDCRDQSGQTRDCAAYHSGWMGNVTLRGILDQEEYYFRNVYLDCIRAVDAALARPEVDERKIILEGGSQGGALVMAVSALDHRACMALPDVPSNSDINERIKGKHGSFGIVQEYLKVQPDQTDRVMEVLSYFDTMNLAERIQCPVFASVGGEDPVCPAKLYFAAYNRIQSEKQIEIYPFNGHEGGRNLHHERKLRYAAEHV